MRQKLPLWVQKYFLNVWNIMNIDENKLCVAVTGSDLHTVAATVAAIGCSGCLIVYFVAVT